MQQDELKQSYRNAMANLAAAVNVVTTDGEGGACGLTATAVCSVSDEPPTLLMCINRRSETNAIFKRNGKVCVNVCHADHQELSCHFAGMTEMGMAERFALDIWERGELEVPRLRDALASFEGRIVDSAEVGTHTVFYVEVSEVHLKGGDALVYFNRAFRGLPENIN